MRFAIFHAVCALWVLWRFWLPMNAPRAVKVAGFVVTLLIAAFPAVTATFFGGLVRISKEIIYRTRCGRI